MMHGSTNIKFIEMKCLLRGTDWVFIAVCVSSLKGSIAKSPTKISRGSPSPHSDNKIMGLEDDQMIGVPLPAAAEVCTVSAAYPGS
jgi:hypothetical protein